MKNKIKQLPRQVYDLIAAGEVVTSPLSAVKELVENSIDAGADAIAVEIEDGGIKSIRVDDNGAGIYTDDIPLAFAAHATSKITNTDDLDNITTLGFRGEALASIAAVSKVILITKTESDETGTKVEIDGGEFVSNVGIGADTGTSISISNLFFNIPARQKHLKSPRTETSKVIDYVSRVAVCFPSIKIRLVSNGTVLFSTRGNGDREAAIMTVYGTVAGNSLIDISAENENLSLTGYISDVNGLKKTRKGQILFVNGRPIKSTVIDNAIDKAYHEFAEPGKFPAVYLFIDIDPSAVDVNVHPAKSEVAFLNPKDVNEFVEDAIRKTLVSARSIPTLKIGQKKIQHKIKDADAVNIFSLKDSGINIDETLTTEQKESYSSSYGGDGDTVESVDINNLWSDSKCDESALSVEKPMLEDTTVPVEKIEPFIQETTSVYGNNIRSTELDIKNLHVLTTLFATYILAADGDNFYIIDQHAAHERVNYEKFMKGYRTGEAMSQQILTPHVFTIPAASATGFEDKIEILSRLGYDVYEFGDKTYATSTVPAFLDYSEAVSFLENLVSESIENTDLESNYAAIDRVVMKSCKVSIKANRSLSSEELNALIKALSECDNPYTCPHGRPVFLKLTKQEIERMFKRA